MSTLVEGKNVEKSVLQQPSNSFLSAHLALEQAPINYPVLGQ